MRGIRRAFHPEMQGQKLRAMGKALLSLAGQADHPLTGLGHLQPTLIFHFGLSLQDMPDRYGLGHLSGDMQTRWTSFPFVDAKQGHLQVIPLASARCCAWGGESLHAQMSKLYPHDRKGE